MRGADGVAPVLAGDLDNEENAVVVEEGESFVYDGQGFVDKTQRPEVVVPVPEPEVKITTKNYTIQQLWYDLLDRFGNKIIINSYGSKHQDATIRITLDQPLNNIIRSLENNPNVLIEYTKTCPDCFEIETLKFLH